MFDQRQEDCLLRVHGDWITGIPGVIGDFEIQMGLSDVAEAGPIQSGKGNMAEDVPYHFAVFKRFVNGNQERGEQIA